MLQIYSTVYEHTLRKINSHAYITKTYHEGKSLPFGTFVLKRNFTHVHFSDKLKPLRIGPYKFLDRLSDVTTCTRWLYSTRPQKSFNSILSKTTTLIPTPA